MWEESVRWGPDGQNDRKFAVNLGYSKKSGRLIESFYPMDGRMKLDTPELRELLREAGYFV